MQLMQLIVFKVCENHIIDENIQEGTDRKEHKQDPQNLNHRHIVHLVGKHQHTAHKKHQVSHHSCENVELTQAHHAEEHYE